MEKPYKDLKSIFFSALESVDPYRIIKQMCPVDGELLIIRSLQGSWKWNLSDFERIVVIGAGKATAKMALAVEELLADRLSLGLISVKYGHTEKLSIVRTIEAGHPVPDMKSVQAAREIAQLARSGDEKTLFINLISGGGSSLLCYPAEPITLEEKQETTRQLLSCGANIREINCLRKHLSGVKGGRLAEMLFPSTCITLILSDVVGDRLDTIASGPTVPDASTFHGAWSIILKYGIEKSLPENVVSFIRLGMEGKIKETPKAEDPVFDRVSNILIGTNYSAIVAAKCKAEELGYNTITLSSQITGEAREIARFYVGIARDIRKLKLLAQPPACIIAGGETTVTVRGKGKGGRNQEMALAFISEIESDPDSSGDIYFLSAATDGNDGPTDAAGGFASLDVFRRGEEAGLKAQEYLERNNSYNYLKKTGYLFKTGPTNTNVCDLQILVVE